MERDSSFDSAKGLGIYSVVLIHIIDYLGWRNGLLSHVIVSYYMPVFFVISGFFTYNDKYSSRDLIRKRFKELICPYLTIAIVINFYRTVILGGEFWNHYLFDESKGGFWFLVVLFIYNCFFAIAKEISGKNSNMFFIVLISIYLFFLLITPYVPYFYYELFSLPSIRKYLPFFIFGMLIRKYEQEVKPWSKQSYVLSGLIYFSLLMFPFSKTYFGLIIWSICATAGSIFIICTFKHFSYLSFPFSGIGKYTLTIYISIRLHVDIKGNFANSIDTIC